MRLVNDASIYAHGVAVKYETCKAMFIIDQEHKVWCNSEAEFTSIVDGKHSYKSLHYAGLACDLRIWYIDVDERKHFTGAIAHLLGPAYDVVLKPDHIHCEFQPKR